MHPYRPPQSHRPAPPGQVYPGASGAPAPGPAPGGPQYGGPQPGVPQYGGPPGAAQPGGPPGGSQYAPPHNGQGSHRPAPGPQRVHWVAAPPAPPPWARRIPQHPPPEPYRGPPSYPATPRWGFPHLVWRWPTSVPGTPSGSISPMERVRVIAAPAHTALWLYAMLTVIAGCAEIWRYVLLVASRNGALSSGVVLASDSVLLSASLLSIAVGALALVLCVVWLFATRNAAATESNVDPPRPAWQVAVGLLVPLLNFVQAGPIVAELEHAVCRRPAGQRPRPSRAVYWWWAGWVASGSLALITLLWRMREGVQAMADGVVLAALTDLAAAAFALYTASLLRRFTALLVPVSPQQARTLRVLAIRDAPAPPLRAERPAGSVR